MCVCMYVCPHLHGSRSLTAMKTEAVALLRRKLGAGERTYGIWVTSEAAAVTEIAVGLGLADVSPLSKP